MSNVRGLGPLPMPPVFQSFAGLVRYDEVAAGTDSACAALYAGRKAGAAFVPPASHWAATSSNALAAPMGMRLRLKPAYDISQFSANIQVILTALKKYGMIMADNGSAMYISGAPDSRWDNDDLHNLAQVPASAFEVVQMNPIYTASNVPQGAAPVSPASPRRRRLFCRLAASPCPGMRAELLT